jgi:hypothetical protein
MPHRRCCGSPAAAERVVDRDWGCAYRQQRVPFLPVIHLRADRFGRETMPVARPSDSGLQRDRRAVTAESLGRFPDYPLQISSASSVEWMTVDGVDRLTERSACAR